MRAKLFTLFLTPMLLFSFTTVFGQSIDEDAQFKVNADVHDVKIDYDVVPLEEVFGLNQNVFGPSGLRGRGNIFLCSTPRKLIEHRFYLNPVSPAIMWFVVYEGAALNGIYNLVHSINVPNQGPGEGWYSSGAIDFDFQAGMYYAIYAQWDVNASYWTENPVAPPYPIPASFGELVTGVGWDWAPIYGDPPPTTQNVSVAATVPVAYYQTIVTDDLGGGAMEKLLLTEFVVTPTAGEFIEIFNPNASPVDLTNYYLSDVAFDGGPEYYYHVVQGLYGGGFGDFNSKFPDGATIGAGEHQIIALNGDADFFTTYAVNPTYEIDQAEFRFGPPDGIPDMMETHPGSIYGADSSHNPGLTNGDEMVMLYYWDGMSDLVSDADYVLYNSGSPAPNNEAVDKSGVTIDGPDPDTTGSTYLNDTPVANQLSALSPTSGFSTQRSDYTEGLQVMSGGNGVTGADETSEDMNNTWVVDIPTPFLAIPVELTSFSASVSSNAVTLNWSTATETNNQGFDVEKNSGNGFEKIGFVAGFGTSIEIHNYSYVDASLQGGTYSYRLKQIDYDGTFEYSDVVEVDVTIPDVYALEQNYPNPFNPSTKIKFSLAADSKVSLTVFDILGQEVTSLIGGNLAAGFHELEFDASNINSGVYFYRLDATGVDGTNFTSVKKMILTK
jgi:hypothetical protein